MIESNRQRGFNSTIGINTSEVFNPTFDTGRFFWLFNNLCERALKMAILHRKNSLGYKTQNGARLGDLFMSLIHTCRLCVANP